MNIMVIGNVIIFPNMSWESQEREFKKLQDILGDEAQLKLINMREEILYD